VLSIAAHQLRRTVLLFVSQRSAVTVAHVRVRTDSWRVKGADSMHDASVAISVRDAAGRLVEAVQETPPPDSVSEQQLRWAAGTAAVCLCVSCVRWGGLLV
jgi:hypothetical protein